MEYNDEVFARIKELPDYAISNYARVLHIKRQTFIKPCLKDNGYLQLFLKVNNKSRYPLLHRLLAKTFIKNEENKPIIDHIDRNKTNNLLSNLRWTDYFVNGANKSKKANKLSKYSGITFDKTRNKWSATIGINYKTIHLGRFLTENEAGLARNNYIIENNLIDVFPLNEIN